MRAPATPRSLRRAVVSSALSTMAMARWAKRSAEPTRRATVEVVGFTMGATVS